MSHILESTLNHTFGNKTYADYFASVSPDVSNKNTRLCERLIRAYHYSRDRVSDNPFSKQKEDLWTRIVKNELALLFNSLEDGNAEDLADFLLQFGGKYQWFGGITTGIDGYNHWDTSEDTIVKTYLDKLLCLAESLGVLPVEVPEFGETGNKGGYSEINPDQVVVSLSEKLKIDVVPPTGVIPVSGLKAQKGVLHYRHINALYSAARIQSLLKGSGQVCEIGGGLGFVAYYLSLFKGFKVTLYDLPITNVLSGYVLLSMLGEEQVELYGEDVKEASVRIQPYWTIQDAKDREYDIVFNQDSFPEIQKNILDFYIENIPRICNRYFLSINHESNHAISKDSLHTSVSELLRNNPQFDFQFRYPYWLRRGYVEELFTIVP